MGNIDWKALLPHAADVVNSYETGVTLRQLFYRLVADETLPNLHNAYKGLSRETAKARRHSNFPALVDRRRGIARPTYFHNSESAIEALKEQFRLDRTRGQEFNIYVGCEKDALSALLETWLYERGIPVLVVGGWHSEGYERAINRDLSWGDALRQSEGDELTATKAVVAGGRKSILLYVGDLDPAGEGIEANILEHVHFDEIKRVALMDYQATELGLPENTNPEVARKLQNHPGRVNFLAKYGRLFQIEVDAVPPEQLEQMINDQIDELWDRSAFEALMEREEEERDEL